MQHAHVPAADFELICTISITSAQHRDDLTRCIMRDKIYFNKVLSWVAAPRNNVRLGNVSVVDADHPSSSTTHQTTLHNKLQHRQLTDAIPDTRDRVPDTSQYPYNTIGIIELYDDDGNLSGYCSGALITPNVVLTAAHCILDTETGKSLGSTSADFTPGYDPESNPPSRFGNVNMLDWSIPTAFKQCVDDNQPFSCHQAVDYGVMLVDANFTAWMVYGFDSTDTGNKTINTAGYPGEYSP